MAVKDSVNNKENLERIKKNIATSYSYQNDNNRRYHDFRKYVFKSSISEQQKTVLGQLKKPVVEANILPAYIARLMGEFAKHEPSIEVSPAEGVPVGQDVIDVVEGHIRHIIYEANKNSFSAEIYKDTLSGGFSAFKVYTDYATPMSFNQNIFWEKCFDPTLVGYDPMARHSHKGDGQFIFEIFPMTYDDFSREYPDNDASRLTYTQNINADSGNIQGFNWSYKDAQNQKVLLVVDYFEKKRKKTRIVKLSDGRTMTMKNYEFLNENWNARGYIEQIPVIVGKPRWTDLETICRYRLNEQEILDYIETDYTFLPIIYVQGDSAVLTEGTSNCTYEMSIPYIYHARGIQDLKNFAMQTLANYLENQIQHKFIIKKEALPQEQDYIEALNNIQDASTIVVNAFYENNPDQGIPEPIREVINVPAPPEVMGAFQISDPTTQTILGSFASNLGRNDADLSGKAVIETATVGNAAAMPYIMGYLAAIKQAANATVDLMPKYLIGDRTIPVVSIHGDKEYKRINAKGEPSINYEERAIHVNIEPGVSFNVQKNQALEQIVALMGASQEFAQFMNSPMGLPILVKNLTIYGADELQEAVPEWIKQQEQQQQQAMQMQQQAMQNDPRMIKAQADMKKIEMDGQIASQKGQLEEMRLQLDAQQNQIQNQIEIAKIATQKELADAKIIESEAKVTQGQIDSAVRLEEANTSLEVHNLEAATKMAEIQSRKHQDHLDTHKHLLEITKFEHSKSNKDMEE